MIPLGVPAPQKPHGFLAEALNVMVRSDGLLIRRPSCLLDSGCAAGRSGS